MTTHNPVSSFYLRCCCTSTHSTRHFSHKTHKRRGCSIFHRGGDEVCLYPGGMGGPERRKSVTFQRQLFWFGDGSLNSETRLAITQIFVLSSWSQSIGWILASRCRSSQKHQRKGQNPCHCSEFSLHKNFKLILEQNVGQQTYLKISCRSQKCLPRLFNQHSYLVNWILFSNVTLVIFHSPSCNSLTVKVCYWLAIWWFSSCYLAFPLKGILK